jgi:hypothetical protein
MEVNSTAQKSNVPALLFYFKRITGVSPKGDWRVEKNSRSLFS